MAENAADKDFDQLPPEIGPLDDGPFIHDTKAGLGPWDMLKPGYNTNYGAHRKSSRVYFTATMEAAAWGA